jgi:two-component system sensor kinase FixL
MERGLAIRHRTATPTGTSRLLKSLIWGFCLVLLIGIWLFVAQQTAFERQQAIADGVRQNINRTIAFEQYVRRTLELADLVTRYVGSRFSRGAAGGEFAGTAAQPDHIPGNLIQGGSFLGISVADARGDVVATSAPTPLARTNVADHPAFRVHVGRDSGRLFVSPPMPSRIANGGNVIWLSRRLNHADGSFAGVVAINILPEQFTFFYRDASVDSLDVMSVIGLDGITRARRTGNVPSSGENLSGRLVMEMQRRHPNGTYLGPSALDGLDRYFSHRRLPEYDLFVTYGVRSDLMLAPSQRRARIFFAGALLTSLALVAFALTLTLYLNRRERRERELATTNDRLREAQRIGQIGDWEFDLKTGAIEWSSQLFAMYGRDPAEGPPTFEGFRAYLDDEGRREVERGMAAAAETHLAQEYNFSVRLPDGTETFHQGVAIPIVDASGTVVGYRGTDQNVSARKMLDQLQTHVAHMSRVEAMNAMASTLAHELNQPLTAASNFIAGTRRKLKADAVPPPGELEQGLALAEQQVHLAADIIRRVRDMVANQPKAVEQVSLARVIADARALVALGTDYPALSINIDLGADARQVNADRIQIQQVMLNLIRNACEAVREGADPRIVISSRREGAGSVTVSVCDNGPGFSQNEEQRFSPFATTKGGGLGLGLSISRTIIEAHGGRIAIGGSPSGGACVHFTLPAPPVRGYAQASASPADAG